MLVTVAKFFFSLLLLILCDITNHVALVRIIYIIIFNVIILQAIPPLPTSSPKQKRYELLLDKPGSYPTMPRREENHVPHTNSTPGKGNLQ